MIDEIKIVIALKVKRIQQLIIDSDAIMPAIKVATGNTSTSVNK